MSALPKGDTEDDSAERWGFLLLELVFTLFYSISALGALGSPVTVFESAFLASCNCLLSINFFTCKTTYYRAQNKQHTLLFDTRSSGDHIPADASDECEDPLG